MVINPQTSICVQCLAVQFISTLCTILMLTAYKRKCFYVCKALKKVNIFHIVFTVYCKCIFMV